MKTKHWIFLLSGIFMISILLLLLPTLFPPSNPVAEVYRDGVLIKTIPLDATSEGLQLPLNHQGMENTIAVSRGGIRISSANCPDKLCVHQGTIRDGATPIVCLPHRLVIKIKTGTRSVDAVSQ